MTTLRGACILDNMRRVRFTVLGLLVLLTVAAAWRMATVTDVRPEIVREPAIAVAKDPVAARPAPEFPHADAEAWINSPPLRMSGLRGRVVVLDVWTFG
jgi:hypothetical protein